MIPLTPELQNALGPAATPAPVNAAPTAVQPLGGSEPEDALDSPTLSFPDAGNGILGGSQPPPAPGSFGAKLGQALDKVGIPPGPGGWAKSILAATQTVLSGLGDAAHAGDKLSPGQGALAGATRTLEARDQRIQEQNKIQQAEKDKQQERQDKLTQQDVENKREQDRLDAYTALTNIQSHHTQMLVNQLGDQAIDKSVQDGKAQLDAMRKAPVPANTIQEGVDEGQMNSLLRQGKINGHEYVALPSGTKVVGSNDDGTPIRRMTYDIVDVPETYEPTPAQVEAIKTVPGYEKYQQGTHMSGAQTNAVLQQARNIETAKDAAEQALTDAGVSEDVRKQTTESAGFAKDGEWNNALANAKGDPSKALAAMLQSQAMRTKYPNILHDVQMQYGKTAEDGAKNIETIRHNLADEQNKRDENLLNKVPEAGGTLTDEVKAQIAALPPDRRAVVEKYPNEAGSLLAVAYGPGDIDFDKVFPARLTKGAPGINAQQAIATLKAINPNWSEQQYRATAAAYKDITQGKNGIQIGQYNNVLNHAADLQDAIEDTSRGKNPRFLNTALNALESQGWGAEATKLNTEVEAVKGEYELLMNAGYKPSEPEQQIYNKIVTGAATPSQIGAFTKVVGSVGAVRLEQINEQYKRIAGKNLPGILTPETVDAARHLNLDPQTMKRLGTLDVGDTIFHNPNWKQPSPAEAQQVQDNKQAEQTAQQAGNKAAREAAKAKGATHTVLGPDGKMHWTNDKGTQDFGIVQ